MFKSDNKSIKLTESVQFKFVAAFFTLIAILLLLLNTYPLMTSRDLVFKEKEGALMSQAAVLSSSLAALDRLSENGVSQVMELLDVSGITRIVVTDESALVLYDTSDAAATGKYALFSELADALGGEQVFRSRFADGAFLSRAAMPVRNGEVTLGAVYLCEYDTEQASLITGIQGRMTSVSAAVCVLALVMTVLFSRALTVRITDLARAIQIVRCGNYAHRIELHGNDELTELGDEFNNLTERLETTESQRRRFVSDASHELKTPLASIRLLSDSIVQSAGMDSATMREFAADIGSEAARLQRTTEKLLDLSRRDDGTDAARRPVDMASVVNSTLRLLTPLAETRQVAIRLSLGDDCLVLASEDDLYQIIFNLAENAIKYNVAAGEVHIEVRRERDRALLTVDDTGIGIPEADREQIFSRFYRVDKARSRENGGSGLGLSIVHDAVEALGGYIEVLPRAPQGTRFAVSFPLAGREEAET
ncbi:MAG: HAMP domain-containing sensor histidine kinase [Oscillospiraceae bacterium]